ncbi:MAG: hypothetical protein NTW62_02585 [Candidatus Nomurabacteria bacterium]|nr:hypothetical protein [Candidatus Nomurabacteria bacterium]
MQELRKIGFDADDTIILTLKLLNEFYNSKYNKKIRIKDYEIYDFSKVWGVSRGRVVEIVNLFYKSELYKQVKIADGAYEAVDYLFKEYDLPIITSRSEDAEEHLRFTLLKLFHPDHFSSVHSVGWGIHSNMEKWEKCKQLEISILIDDYHSHLISAAKQGIYGILIPAPWNKNITDLPKEIFRVRNLSEAVDVVEKNKKIIWTQ